MAERRLGIGIIGSGFNAKFHLQAFVGVRDADVLGIWSPNNQHAREAASLARKLRVGRAKAFATIGEMVEHPGIDAIWVCGPNDARIANLKEVVAAVARGAELNGIACEKPLARNAAEAREVLRMVERAKLNHGYMENQLFAPSITRGRDIIWTRGARLTGRPYLARAAEEHAGPHMPWFWQGRRQGGGVLNDMMCHSIEVVRFLLTKPGAPRSSLTLRSVSAQIASLKWSRRKYAARLKRMMGKNVDYRRRPAEDFATVTAEFEADDGDTVIGEATTSWSFVGAGLRLSGELLGPEYSLQWNTLDTDLKLFFSREVRGSAGEDLVEKQNAEMGLMPVVSDEANAYGYVAEDRHFVQAFLDEKTPSLTFHDGLAVVDTLMTAYMSAERGRTLGFPPRGLRTFKPAVARGKWRP